VRMIVRNNRELKARYNELTAGDVFIGNLSSKYLKQPMLIDMQQRGIRCLPSPLSQILTGSKVAQAFMLHQWMFPKTRVIFRRTDLIEAINAFARDDIGPVVTKQDGMHCGHGIRRWETIETLYSFMALNESSYPFVLQPFQERFTDIRVIIAGDYVESYTRANLYNFRVNISLGGSGSPCRLDDEKEALCRSVMQRGRFPFAHLDLMFLEDGSCYLSEIALNGGLRGARIDRQELEQKKMALLEELAKHE
jgi:glutathione synthase/RimK-type ligase-like ATP-grasp enzyme